VSDLPPVPQAQIDQKWFEVSEALDALVRRLDRRDEWQVESRSSLSGDDAAASPYHVSHAVVQCLFTGVQHMHALKTLIVDAQALHLGPPWTLARTAVENLATAYWILHPSNRKERVARTLRWHYRNLRDQEEALRPVMPKFDPLSVRIAKLRRAVEANGLDLRDIKKGYTSTGVVRYLDEHVRGRGDLLLWRIGSGMAHGRPWAYLGLSDQEISPAADDDAVHVRMTDDVSRVLLPILRAVHVTEDLLILLEQRRTAHI